MGSSHASNIIDNSISAMVKVDNNTEQKCAPTISSDQAINAISDGCPGSKIVIHDVKMASTAMMDVKCMQQAAQSGSADIQIAQAAKQMAESLTQALSLNPASSQAENIMRMSMNVGAAIKNNISQIISSAASMRQTITAEGCDIEIYAIDMSTFGQTMAEAAQKTSQVAAAILALKQEADQIAKAKQASLMGPLIVILIIIALVFFGPAKVLLKYAEPVLYAAVPAAATYASYKVYRYFKPKNEGFSCGASQAVRVRPHTGGARQCKKEGYLPVEFTYPDDPLV